MTRIIPHASTFDPLTRDDAMQKLRTWLDSVAARPLWERIHEFNPSHRTKLIGYITGTGWPFIVTIFQQQDLRHQPHSRWPLWTDRGIDVYVRPAHDRDNLDEALAAAGRALLVGTGRCMVPEENSGRDVVPHEIQSQQPTDAPLTRHQIDNPFTKGLLVPRREPVGQHLDVTAGETR